MAVGYIDKAKLEAAEYAKEMEQQIAEAENKAQEQEQRVRDQVKVMQADQKKATEKLRGAAMMDETLYGMLAREQLVQQLPRAGETPDLDADDWRVLNDEENVRAARTSRRRSPSLAALS